MAYRNKVMEVVREITDLSSLRFENNQISKIEIANNEFSDEIFIKSNSVVFNLVHTYVDGIGALDTVNLKIEITVWGMIKVWHCNAISDHALCRFMDSFKSSYNHWFQKEKLADNSVKELMRKTKKRLEAGLTV